MIDFVKVGNKIATLRKHHGLSQEELAEKLYVTRQALSKWENGSVPSIDVVLLLAKSFNVSFEELLCLDEPEEFKVDLNDIFKSHPRNVVLNALLTGKWHVDLPKVFPQFNPTERWIILKAIKEKKIQCSIPKLQMHLTPAESHFLKGGQ